MIYNIYIFLFLIGDDEQKEDQNLEAEDPYTKTGQELIISSERNHPAPSATVYEIFQNERYYAFAGWSSRLLPFDPHAWSDRLGDLMTKEMIDNSLSQDWIWR